MFTKRTFIALSAAAVVAACTNVTELNRIGDSNPRKLNLVNVDTSRMDVVTEGRAITKSRAQLASDLTAAITREAQPYSDPNGAPADLNVVVNKVYLAPLVERTVLGTSYIESTISVTDGDDGSTIISPANVKATSDTLRGIGTLGAVAAVANANVQTDYQNAINGYAKALVASVVATRQ